MDVKKDRRKKERENMFNKKAEKRRNSKKIIEAAFG
jgi:hypothetical protein